MATPTILTVRALLGLHRAFNSLDAVRSGKDEIVILEFSGSTRAKIMANFAELEAIKEIHDATDRALAKQHGVVAGMDENAENGARLDAYRRALIDAANETREVHLHRIALSALLNKPGDGKTIRLNPVPQSVLNLLTPILDYDVE